MRHHKLHRSLLIALILVFLTNTGLLVLHVTGRIDLGDLPQARLPLLALLLSGTAVWLVRHRYRRWQRELNQAASQQGVLLLLAPHPDEPLANHDLYRRFPGQYIQRQGDWPCTHIGLELVGDPFQMRYGIFLPDRQLRPAAVKEIAHEWHGTQIEAVPMTAKGAAADLVRGAAVQGQARIVWCRLKLEKDDVYPLHILDEPKRYGSRARDQAETFLAAVNATTAGVQTGVQILIRPAPASVADRWSAHVRKLEEKLNNKGTRSRRSGDGLAVTSQSYGPQNEHRLRQEIGDIAPRLGEVKYEVSLTIFAAGDKAGEELEREMERIAQNIQAETRGQYNELVMAERGRIWTPVLGRQFPEKGGFILTAGELGRLFHIPDRETMSLYPKLHISAANVRGPVADVIVPPAQVPAHILPGEKQGPRARVYGTFDTPTGEKLYVGQPLSATVTHSLVTGSNGTGKSVGAANIALQDWLGGNAVLVIDPHGALLDDILAGVPLEREGEIHILDMESKQPFQFNICRVGYGQGIETTVDYLMEAIRIGEPASWDSAVGMKEVLENAFTVALYGDASASLTDVAGVLDPATRLGMVEKVTAGTPEAQEAVHFWQEVFPNWNKNDQKRALTAAQRRVKKFLKSPALRRTLAGSHTTFDLAEAIRRRKLILVPMPKTLGAETKRIWSALLVREFISVMMRLPEADRKYTTLIVDELKDTIGTLAEFVKSIVEQLRKYDTSGNFFTQAFNHLPEDVLLVFKNECRTQVCFNCGPDNAAIAASVMGDGVTARDIQKLPPHHAFVKLAIPGAQTSPCLIYMLPPISPPKTAVPPGHEGPKPQPPRNIFKTAPAGINPAHWQPEELLQWLEAGAANSRDTILTHLSTLSLTELEAVWQKKRQLDRWRREQLVKKPWIIPDKVKRIKAISAATIGIPWWLSDMAYAQKRIQSSPVPKRQRDTEQTYD